MGNHIPIEEPFILNLYKPKGITSTKVVSAIKWGLGKKVKKVGHFGTLDPFAEGVLLVGGNGACRLNNLLHEKYPKTYLAKGLLGKRTDTGDCEGEIIEEKEVSDLKADFIKTILDEFKGEYLQSPPAFSATKHEGKPLYKWAREGVKIEKPPVERFIHTIEFVSFEKDEVTFRVTVSTGTYIRVLFEDIATKLNNVGHLVELKRERIGPLIVENALKSGQWPGEDNFKNENFIKVTNAFEVQSLVVKGRDLKAFSHGNPLKIENVEFSQSPSKGDYIWVCTDDEQILGLASVGDEYLTSCFNFPLKTP